MIFRSRDSFIKLLNKLENRINSPQNIIHALSCLAPKKVLPQFHVVPFRELPFSHLQSDQDACFQRLFAFQYCATISCFFECHASALECCVSTFNILLHVSCVKNKTIQFIALIFPKMSEFQTNIIRNFSGLLGNSGCYTGANFEAGTVFVDLTAAYDTV